MTKREELLEQGYGCVVLGRTAHRTEGECWTEKNHLIPLASMEEAASHRYEMCRKCVGSTSGRATTRPRATSERT